MRTLKTYLLFLASIITFNLAAQYKISRADSAHFAGNYRLAINLYNQQGKKSVDDNLLNVANSYAALGQNDSAIYYIKRQKDLWGLPIGILSVVDFVSLHGNPEWEEIAGNLENEYFKKNPDLKRELVEDLWQMGIDDKYYRGDFRSYIKKYGEGSNELDSIKKLQAQLDSTNLIKLNNMVSKYGWPKNSDIGDPITGSVPFLIIQHSDNIAVQKKYLPIIEERVKQNEADPAAFAYLFDRILVNENKKQIYGTQTIRNIKTGKDEVCPIEDESNVDKRRAEFGLGPLKEYLQMFGIEYENK
jgi:hypothetical protein